MDDGAATLISVKKKMKKKILKEKMKKCGKKMLIFFPSFSPVPTLDASACFHRLTLIIYIPLRYLRGYIDSRFLQIPNRLLNMVCVYRHFFLKRRRERRWRYIVQETRKKTFVSCYSLFPSTKYRLAVTLSSRNPQLHCRSFSFFISCIYF